MGTVARMGLIDFFAPEHHRQTLLCPFGAKKSFLSEMVQRGPDGPKKGPKWSPMNSLLAGPHNLQSFLTANSTHNYFFIARMISFFVTFGTKVP